MEKRFLLRLPAALYERLETEARAQHRSVNAQLNAIIEQYLGEDENMDTTYRAAVWTANDGQAEVRLTGPEQAHLPDDELIAEAKAELKREGGTMNGGRIIITEWSD